MQRIDSVNLIAAFVKANENDYMIINEDGIIDGVGMNFKMILGEKVAKLPLDLICT
jgi:polynucleotide 5'-kinase involved in rRNA processing